MINIDKIKIQIKNKYEITELVERFSQIGYRLEKSNEINNNFFETYCVNDKFKLLYKHRQHGTSKIEVDNSFLYKKEFNDFLKNISSKFNCLEIKHLELAYDTTVNLLSKYESYLELNEIGLKKGYKTTRIVDDINYFKPKSDIHPTIYFVRENEWCVSGKKQISNRLRIENKSKEPLAKNKPYIFQRFPELLINGEELFRMELILIGSQIKSKEIRYYDDEGDSISNYEYKKHLKVIHYDNGRKIIDENYQNAIAIILKYKHKKTVIQSYDLTIEKLCDKEYLFRLFVFFSKKIFTNVDDFLNIKSPLKNITYSQKLSNIKKVNKIITPREKAFTYLYTHFPNASKEVIEEVIEKIDTNNRSSFESPLFY